jgi:hypothetical protein
MKTPTQIYDQHTRIQRKIDDRARLLSAKADPATQGNFCLVHNWGNPEARAIWDKACQRAKWARSSFEHLHDLAEHRSHGLHFKPSWCRYCREAA